TESPFTPSLGMEVICCAVDAFAHRAVDLKVAFANTHGMARLEAAFAEESRRQIALCRCIFGNPFRPVTVNPEWLTSTVIELARGIYDERAFDRLPILGDALQDAGCDNEDVLNHCRGDGPHARGCWVVDLVLGKE